LYNRQSKVFNIPFLLRLAVAIEEGLFFIIMKISELPEKVKIKALEYQKNDGDDIATDNLAKAFIWKKTNEGFDFWMNWDLKENNNDTSKNYFKTITNPYVEKPKQYQIGIDTFARAESNLTKEEILAICKFNIDKYTWRQKGQDKEDFQKIIDYANWALKNL